MEAGAYNHFQSGSIYHSAATGAHEVRGLIRDKWVKLGSEKSVLGFPATNEIGTPGRPGAFNHFYNEQDGSVGSIFWSPATGAHMLRGPIRERWAQLGWEASALGFPVKDEYLLAGGGRRSDFQHGYITWRPSTGAVVQLSSASG